MLSSAFCVAQTLYSADFDEPGNRQKKYRGQLYTYTLIQYSVHTFIHIFEHFFIYTYCRHTKTKPTIFASKTGTKRKNEYNIVFIFCNTVDPPPPQVIYITKCVHRGFIYVHSHFVCILIATKNIPEVSFPA
jgi:hypothetical protein